MSAASILHPVLAVVLAPLLPGVINRTKALFAGRKGPPLLQAYYDLWKLFRKGAVYSGTTTWVFRAGPLVNFACLLVALAVLPLFWTGRRLLRWELVLLLAGYGVYLWVLWPSK